MRAPSLLALGIVLALGATCTSSADRASKERLLGGAADGADRPPFDWNRPEACLAVGASEAAERLGAFDWTAAVTWTVSRPKSGARARVAERHRVRQSALGDFEVQSDLDPGEGPGAETGKRVIWAGKMTYGKGRYPSSGWRERPTDRGRDARRFRDESFGLLADLAGLYGPALKLVPAGEGTALGRPARRFQFALSGEAADGLSRLGAQPPTAGVDEDTRRRLAFLDGRTPVRAEGEILADAESGVPLHVRLRGAFRVKGDPDAYAEVELSAQVQALGAAVAAVSPPPRALPDERKPRGVAQALEASGLRKKGEPEEKSEEPDEGE
jgi:hypothetical protein